MHCAKDCDPHNCACEYGRACLHWFYSTQAVFYVLVLRFLNFFESPWLSTKRFRRFLREGNLWSNCRWMNLGISDFRSNNLGEIFPSIVTSRTMVASHRELSTYNWWCHMYFFKAQFILNDPGKFFTYRVFHGLVQDKICWMWFKFRLKPIITTVQAASKNDAQVKNGQNQSKNFST